jgi:hypothetical protein
MSLLTGQYFDVLPTSNGPPGATTTSEKRKFFRRMPQWDDATYYHGVYRNGHGGLPEDVMKKESLTRLVEASMGEDEQESDREGDGDDDWDDMDV